jgi:hypothetical protein
MSKPSKVTAIPSGEILDKILANGIDYRVLESVLNKIARASGKEEEAVVCAIMAYEVAKYEFSNCSGLPFMERYRIVSKMQESKQALDNMLRSLGRPKYPP